MADSEVIGFDVPAVEAWVAARVPELEGPLTWERLAGGHSNLTYRITAPAGRRAVIRRPPLGELLPKAHDMGREFRVIEALAPTSVPVPEPLAFCDSPDVTGAVFYVMSSVDGRTLYTRDDLEALVPEDRRDRLARSLVGALADLHAVDPADVGLDRLGRPDGYVARQLHRWYGSWQASEAPSGISSAAVDRTFHRLAASVPEQPAVRVVHGDYAFHNTIATAEGRIAAVIDWEISTLGDPLADFAYLLNAYVRPDDPLVLDASAPTLADGFPDRSALVDLYADRTGFDLAELDFYAVFNQFKTVCILQGVYARYVNGQKDIDAESLAALRTRLLRAIDRVATADADA